MSLIPYSFISILGNQIVKVNINHHILSLDAHRNNFANILTIKDVNKLYTLMETSSDMNVQLETGFGKQVIDVDISGFSEVHNYYRTHSTGSEKLWVILKLLKEWSGK